MNNAKNEIANNSLVNGCYESDVNIPGMELVRTGKCDPKKCGSFCCKFVLVTGNRPTDDYWRNFSNNQNNFGDHIFFRNCRHLDARNNKCKVWDTPEFPEVCKQFPNPTDPVYRHVFKTCSFRFELRPKGE